MHPPRSGLPYGSLTSSFSIANSLIGSNAFTNIDFIDEAYKKIEEVQCGICKVRQSYFSNEGKLPDCYDVIYLSGGHFQYSSFSQRQNTITPVVAEIGTTHSPEQWSSLIISILQNDIREYDGLIFKSNRTRDIFVETLNRWRNNFCFQSSFKYKVITNGVDLKKNNFSHQKREEFRRRFNINKESILFLAYSRISPNSKVDYESLILLWKNISETNPNAILVISGAIVTNPDYRDYPEKLLKFARDVGVYKNIRVIANPHDLWEYAQSYVMSGCDAFIHTTKGLEESTSNVVLEALAHSLPVLASNWAGMPDLIEDKKNGFLVDCWGSKVPYNISHSIFSRDSLFINSEIEKYIVIDNEKLSNIINEVMTNKSLLDSLRDGARRSVESKFDINDKCKERVDFFYELIEDSENTLNTATNTVPVVDVANTLLLMSNRFISDESVLYISSNVKSHGKNYLFSKLNYRIGFIIFDIIGVSKTISIKGIKEQILELPDGKVMIDIDRSIMELLHLDIVRIK